MNGVRSVPGREGRGDQADNADAQLDVYRRAREHLVALRAAGEMRGKQWANAVAWPKDLPPELRDKLASLAVTCLALDDIELAILLEAIVAGPRDSQTGRTTTVRIIGAQERAVEIHACDPLLPLMNVSTVLQQTASKELEAVTVPSGESLVVSVETHSGEPTVRIPVAPGTREITIDLSALSQLHLPVPARFVPPTSAIIGADLLARNSLQRSRVELGPLAVQETPVTVEQLAALGGDPAQCRYLDRRLFDDDLRPRHDVLSVRSRDKRAFPAVGLDLSDVQAFLSQLPELSHGSWDLLDDREWEALFRGPEGHIYPWGNRWLDGAANVLGSQAPALEPVASRPLDISRWGLRDGAGNTEEWTTPREELVAKGGSWYNDKQIGRCASRVVRAPEYRHPKLGFRLVVRL